MVRVLSIPLFKKQNVNSIERSVSTCCVALPNKFLVASSSTHCIEVNNVEMDDLDLDENNALVQIPAFSFPTVDSVKQIIHCLNGNYIATIESKSNTRQNRTTSYVRVYANWDSVATLQQSKMNLSGVSLGQSECGMVQPMRARIAGRVTPSITQSGDVSSLEMIEIPVKRTPTLIASCQITGNLLIASDRRLTIYQCVVKTHDTSKQTFLDFELVPQYYELSFKPSKIAINENYITAFSCEQFYVFKISPVKLIPKRVSSKSAEKRIRTYTEDICIDYQKICDNPSTIVNLPMVTKENVLMYKNLPFMHSFEIDVTIKSSSPIDSSSQQHEVENILQLKIRPEINVEGVIHPIQEEFSCFAVNPVYITENNYLMGNNNGNKEPDKRNGNQFLESSFNKHLKRLVFMVATSQEGYLFHIDTKQPLVVDNVIFKKSKIFELDNKYLEGVYSFTTPVLDIILQDTILHALTYSGLESYTLKPPRMIFPHEDPIYLIDLKSFLGVKQILRTEKNLILLANYDTSPVRSTNSSSSSGSANWTLYNLELPSVIDLNKDILKIAEFHKTDSIQTYLHLLNKSYILLKFNLLLMKFEIKWDGTVGVVVPIEHNEKQDDILKDFKKSCLLLGDFFLMRTNEDENEQSIFYYNLANLKPIEILNRFLDLEKTGNDAKELQGLLHYLKKIILEMKFGEEADDMFTSIPDSSQYITGIINNFKCSSNSSSTIDSTESTDNLSLPHNSSGNNSPFCSLRNLLTDQELSGPASLLLPENLITGIVNNFETETNDNDSSTTTPELGCIIPASPEPNFGQTFADLILDIFNVFQPSEIAHFVIKNAVIREYATNKIISILNQRNQRTDNDNLALVLLYLQKNDMNKAKIALNQCSDLSLLKTLVKNHLLLFDTLSERKTHNKPLGFSELTTLLIANKTDLLSDILYNILTPSKYIPLREIIRIFVEYLPSHVGELSANATHSFYLTLEKYLLNYFSKLKDIQRPLVDNIIKESLKLLCRCYISKLLIATNLCQSFRNPSPNSSTLIEQVESYSDLLENENYLFKHCRYEYLNQIPMFDMFCPIEGTAEMPKKKSIYNILIKLEALLCSNVLPSSAINEVDIFLKNHSHFVGKIRLQSIILPLDESINILVNRYPICLNLFGQERFSDESNWQQLILALEKQVHILQNKGLRGRQKLSLTETARREILVYLATNYPYEKFMKTLPTEDLITGNESTIEENNKSKNDENVDDYKDNNIDCNNDDDLSDSETLVDIPLNIDMKYKRYARFIELCRNASHANQIQQFIIATGQQLLTTLNL